MGPGLVSSMQIILSKLQNTIPSVSRNQLDALSWTNEYRTYVIRGGGRLYYIYHFKRSLFGFKKISGIVPLFCPR